MLRQLADRFTASPYAAYALYSAALYAERRASDQQGYTEAYNLLEELVTKHPQSTLLFYARLKQGNLLRAMGDYGRARTTYADLVNRFQYPAFPDAPAAQLALADTEASMVSRDASRAGSAAAGYEKLYDLPTVPIDVRAEAGYKLGLGRLNRENPERAATIWWRMIEEFLRDDTKARTLGPRGRYWLARTVIKLAEELEAQAKPREARELYQLVIDKQLQPAMTHAREGLARTGGK